MIGINSCSDDLLKRQDIGQQGSQMELDTIRAAGSAIVGVSNPQVRTMLIACRYAWEQVPVSAREHALELILADLDLLFMQLAALSRD